MVFAGNLPNFSCTCSAGVDLNRDFPDTVRLKGQGLGPQGTEQPETLALMQWLRDTHFIASAVMHEVGWIVAWLPTVAAALHWQGISLDDLHCAQHSS